MEATHPLEGLAKGPYTFLGLETQENRVLEATFAREAGRPYTTNTHCGGSCDLCGMAITNVYRFRGADGRAFKLGCDCAELGFANTPEMLKAVKEAKNERRRALRQASQAESRAKRAERRQAEQVSLQAKQEAAASKLRAEHPEWFTWTAALAELEGFSGTIGREFGDCIDRGFALSANKVALLERLYKQECQPDPGHYGSPGTREKNVPVTCEAKTLLDTQFGITRLYKFRTESGHVLTCFHGGSSLGLEAGDSARISFSIKHHGEYEGRSVTRIVRTRVCK